MEQTLHKYVIVTAARDEEKYIGKTIESIVAQTLLPAAWIIVDDGSADKTSDIVSSYACKYPWIKLVCRERRQQRQYGGGELDAFYHGLAELGNQEWNFLVKLDADVSFEKDYFELCFRHFEYNPKLGIGGGKVLNNMQGKLIFESQPRFHVRGATKIYRKECWLAIGGIKKTPGWETLDEVMANMLGWQTYTFDEPSLIHHRITGASVGEFRSYVDCGIGSYFVGYHPLFLLARSAKLLFNKHCIKSAAGLLYGFLRGYLKGRPPIVGKEVIRYVSRQQLNRLFFRETIWK